MASMFERYTDLAKRAIFFARYVATKSNAATITSVDLLAGLMFDDASRAQTLFDLREHFPVYSGRPWTSIEVSTTPGGPALDDHAKQALAWTAELASRLGDYWIDTEHILLGLLHVRVSQAAVYLDTAGLTLEIARKTIVEKKSSRPEYGPVPRLWPYISWLRRNF